MVVKRPPLVVLLLHIGACADAVRWAGKRQITAATLRACPSVDWRQCLAAKVGVRKNAPWSNWCTAIDRTLAGPGDGDGSGYGSGSGYGYGSASGYGYGDGDGSGESVPR